jgi:hypothetical protein
MKFLRNWSNHISKLSIWETCGQGHSLRRNILLVDAYFFMAEADTFILIPSRSLKEASISVFRTSNMVAVYLWEFINIIYFCFNVRDTVRFRKGIHVPKYAVSSLFIY